MGKKNGDKPLMVLQNSLSVLFPFFCADPLSFK